eukprot:scaffold66965_cov42-Phaeocystis_antarctica.AAC.1
MAAGDLARASSTCVRVKVRVRARDRVRIRASTSVSPPAAIRLSVTIATLPAAPPLPTSSMSGTSALAASGAWLTASSERLLSARAESIATSGRGDMSCPTSASTPPAATTAARAPAAASAASVPAASFSISAISACCSGDGTAAAAAAEGRRTRLSLCTHAVTASRSAPKACWLSWQLARLNNTWRPCTCTAAEPCHSSAANGASTPASTRAASTSVPFRGAAGPAANRVCTVVSCRIAKAAASCAAVAPSRSSAVSGAAAPAETSAGSSLFSWARLHRITAAASLVLPVLPAQVASFTRG